MSKRPIMLVVPDGMAGWEQPEFDNQTPLDVSDTPNLDHLTEQGRLYRLQNIPHGCAADSAIANLALLGYDPREYHLGRGPLEAINLGIELKPGEVAFRCNLVTVNEHDVLTDYSAHNLETEVNHKLFECLNDHFQDDGFRFVPGLRYRGILIVEGMEEVKCHLPHDEMGEKISEIMPSGNGAERLSEMMIKSREILSGHRYNRQQREQSKPMANMAWPWGNGRVRELPSVQDTYNRTGSVVAGVDLIQGLGQALGLEKIDVPGATGDYETDMRGKAEAAVEELKELKEKELIFLHVEAIDEAGHDGDAELKVEMIERWDEDMMGPVRQAYEQKDFTLLVAPDHYTPIQKRTHVDDPVPLLVADGEGTNDLRFREDDSRQAPFVESGWEVLSDFYADRENQLKKVKNSA